MSEQRSQWIVSVVVTKPIPTGFNAVNKLYDFFAVSRDEAIGKAVLQSQIDFPDHRLHTVCTFEIKPRP